VANLDLILVLLATGVALQVLAGRLGIPRPALLVIGGTALALVTGLPRPGLDPAVIFLVFVPPLLYYASTMAPLRELAVTGDDSSLRGALGCKRRFVR